MRKLITLCVVAFFAIGNGFSQTIADIGWDWDGSAEVAPVSGIYISDGENMIYEGTENEMVISLGGSSRFDNTDGGLYVDKRVKEYEYLEILNNTTDYVEVSLTANSAEKLISQVKLNGTSNNTDATATPVVLFSDQLPFDESRIIGYEVCELTVVRVGDAGQVLTAPEGTKSYRIYRRLSIKESDVAGVYEIGSGQVVGGGQAARIGYFSATLVDDNNGGGDEKDLSVADIGWDWDGSADSAPVSGTYLVDGENVIYEGTESEVVVLLGGSSRFDNTDGGLYVDKRIKEYGYMEVITNTTDYIEVSLTDNSAGKLISQIKINGTSNSTTASATPAVLFSDRFPFDEERIIGYNDCELAFTRAGDAGHVLTAPEGTKSYRIYRKVAIAETAVVGVYEISSLGFSIGGGNAPRIGYLSATLVEDEGGKEPIGLFVDGEWLDVAALSGTDLSGCETLVLSGEWQELAFEALATALGTNEVITSVDVSAVSLPATDFLVGIGNPNCLIFVAENTSYFDSWANVIVGESAGAIVLSDDYPFESPKEFTAESVTYSRTYTVEGWASLCLPFDIQVAELPQGVKVYEFTKAEGTKVNFDEVESGTLLANTPYIADISDIDEKKVFEVTQHVFVPATEVLSVTKGDYTFRGSFKEIRPAEGLFLLDGDGKGFGKGTATSYVLPFRAYIESLNGADDSVKQLSVGLNGDDITSIDSSLLEEGLSIRVSEGKLIVSLAGAAQLAIYTVDGVLVKRVEVQEGETVIEGLPRGIYLVNNQKVVLN